jgi:hypothetical protein
MLKIPPFLKNLATCEIIWKNIVDPNREQVTVSVKQRLCFAYWINKAIDTQNI